MRYFGIALAASALFLGACGGGDTAADATTDQAPVTDAAAPAPAAGGDVAAAPVTGEIHVSNMVGDANGYRFEPAELTVKQGDGVRFVMVSMPPHNAAFENVDPAVVPQLNANIPEKMGDLSTKMMMTQGEEAVVSFANIPPGKYDFICTPHLAMGMRGSVTVTQ